MTSHVEADGAGRHHPSTFLCSILSLLACAALGCSDGGEPGARSERSSGDESAAAEPARHDAEAALAFEAGEDQLVSAAQEAVRQSPDEARAYVVLATALLRRERETSNARYLLLAEDAIRAGRSRDSDDHHLAMLHAMTLQERHRFEAARDEARRILRRRPDDTTAHILHGDALLELGDYDGAADAFQRAIDLRPDLRSYERGAWLRWLHGDFAGAVEMLELALDSGSARDPEGMAWCFVDLAVMHVHRGDAARATAAADRALALVPDYVPALSARSRADALEGRSDRAIETLQNVVGRAPSVSDLVLLGELLEEAGRREDSDAAFTHAERLSSTDPRPWADHLARRGVRSDAALRLAERELEARQNVEAFGTAALAQVRAGRTDDAERSIRRALALGTPDASLYLTRALVHVARRDREGARRALGHALALNPRADAGLVQEIRSEIGEEV